MKRAPLHEPYYDFYQWGGIIRSVLADELPPVAIDWVKVTTRDYKKGEIEVQMRVTGEPEDMLAIDVEINRVKQAPVTVKAAHGTATFSMKIASPKPWSMESPNLYELRVILGEDDMIVRFGLRQVKNHMGKIFLNDKPVKTKRI